MGAAKIAAYPDLTYRYSFDKDIGEGAKGLEFKTREINNIVIYDIKWEFEIVVDMPVALHRHVKGQLENGRRNFLFNFKNVTYLESLGLGEMVGCLISISKLGGKLKLTNLIPRIHLMFEVTGLDKIFEIFDNEEQALKNFY